MLYGAMSEAYDNLSSRYGFGCKGCVDNCCVSKFHHHTRAEYYYLLEGMNRIETGTAKEIVLRAQDAVRLGESDPDIAIMCPANFDGLCKVYEHRPMICRLHGVPHGFRRPDGAIEKGSGCAVFQSRYPDAEDAMDRTVLYTLLADIERYIRQKTGFRDRYSKTTAEMIVEMINSDQSLKDRLGL